MKIKKMIYYGASLILNRIFRHTKLKRNHVLFLSDVRSDLSGNFKFVYEALGDGYVKHLALKEDRRQRRSLNQWLLLCKYLGSCQYILLDDYSEATALIHLQKDQQLIQLWHGSGAFKKFAHSRHGEGGDIQRIHPGYKKYTMAITSSEKVNRCFAEAFDIPESRIQATGIPRTDIFFDDGYKQQKIREFYCSYPELADKKIILFAPTYRGTKVEDASYDFSKVDIEALYQKLHDEYVIVFKWHPALYNNIVIGRQSGVDLAEYPGFAYDLSEYREVNDLLFISDLVVTDYSSVIFDYALLEKPIVYFVYDLDEYKDDRGFYFPFEEYIYGSIVQNSEQLISKIMNPEMMNERRKCFIEKFVAKNDGQATKRVIKMVFEDRNQS